MVHISEKRLNSLLFQLAQHTYHNSHNHSILLNSLSNKDFPDGTAGYIKFLDSVDTKQIAAVTDELGSWEKHLLDVDLFMDRVEPELNNILKDSAPTMEKHVEGFYNAGKEVGFKQMDVASFFGESDKHALYTLKNYNFDLIVTKSEDFRDKVRSEVWKGTARGDSIEAIAKNIRQEPVNPIYNPYYKAKMNQEDRSILIARTESMRAMNQGHLLSYQQYAVEQVDIPESGTEGDFNCDCPDAVDGSPYDINDPNLPLVPLHPNCTHTYAPHGMPTVEGAMDPDTYINLVLGGATPVVALD
jgi:hypothetical protein